MGELGKLRDCRVAILGLGMMGGSLALALRGKCKELLAVDPDPATIEIARTRDIVRKISSDSGKIVPQADVLVLAAPVAVILDLIEALPALHPGSPIVIDLGSTKRQICKKLDLLPERFEAVGGHPMCGKEVASLANADPTIFIGATFALVPAGRTTPLSEEMAEQIALEIGSQPLWMDAERHDEMVAATSHLPYLLANALSLATPEQSAALVGSGFKSAARLSSSYTPMMLDVLASNQDNVQVAARRFREQLELLESALANKVDDELEELLKLSAAHYRRLVDPGVNRDR